jgi:CBS domain-containing protein
LGDLVLSRIVGRGEYMELTGIPELRAGVEEVRLHEAAMMVERRNQSFPVVDENNCLLGILSRGDIIRALKG